MSCVQAYDRLNPQQQQQVMALQPAQQQQALWGLIQRHQAALKQHQQQQQQGMAAMDPAMAQRLASGMQAGASGAAAAMAGVHPQAAYMMAQYPGMMGMAAPHAMAMMGGYQPGLGPPGALNPQQQQQQLQQQLLLQQQQQQQASYMGHAAAAAGMWPHHAYMAGAYPRPTGAGQGGLQQNPGLQK